MNIISILYFLLIRPLELIYEFIFSVSYQNSGNAFFSIVILSISVGLLSLPLYNRADKLQQESTVIEKHMKPGKDRIKKAFKGDEQVLLLQAYYKEKHYHPLMILRSSFSLLLQIPFFIAAYRMLSSCIVLRGAPLGPIADLGAPDGLLRIGNAAVNVLPVLMTVINIISGTVYSKGMGLRAKLQLYITALIFLVLLYGSPSGLVLYWTLNNIFSLIKNMIQKLMPKADTKRLIKTHNGKRTYAKLFILYALCCSFFIGLLIPSEIYSNAAGDLITNYNYVRLSDHILISVLISTGIFVIWGGIYYLTLNRSSRTSAVIMIVIFADSAVNYFGFYDYFGSLNRYLYINSDYDVFSGRSMLNLFVLLIIAVLICILIKNIPSVMTVISVPVLIAVITVSCYNLIKLDNIYDSYAYVKDQQDYPEIVLSADKPNVVVIMLDRAVGRLTPAIMKERPDILERFDGFTYYENSLSLSIHTNTGSPELFGGYDYTPQAMNLRADDPIPEKHNEAIRVMPVIFGENGYNVTVCDPPYAGDYREIPNLSVYDEYPYINAYITEEILDPYHDDIAANWNSYMEDNLFSYSLRLAAPIALRDVIYDNGNFNDLNRSCSDISFFQRTPDISHAAGIDCKFADSYYALSGLSGITRITDDGSSGSFVMIANYSTHESAILEEPSYTPSFTVDNSEYDRLRSVRFEEEGLEIYTSGEMGQYHTQAAAFAALADWFDQLRQAGVYDNTRIIITSDHGSGYYLFGLTEKHGLLNLCAFNCLFMVKDFDSTGFTVSDEFITNADTPATAFRDLIDDPVNPFTGNPIVSVSDNTQDLMYFFSSDQNVRQHRNPNLFNVSPWYTYDPSSGDIRDEDAWEYIGDF